MNQDAQYDVLIIGAGAAGLMCAIEAGKRGRRVRVIDKAEKAGKKILISGGGRCNFTNMYIDAAAYLSGNMHFCKSALAQFSQWDFMALMQKHGLSWQAKTLGQLFCEQKAPAVVKMLLDECEQAGVDICLQCEIEKIDSNSGFCLQTSLGEMRAESLVIATGGPSIPRMGSTDFALQIARKFSLPIIPFKAALVPFTFSQTDIDRYFKGLSGISLAAEVSCNGVQFRENILITHRGISGPACLQISSYWRKGDALEIDLLPGIDAGEWLLERQQSRGRAALKTILSEHLPKRLAQVLPQNLSVSLSSDTPLGDIRKRDLQNFAGQLNHWVLHPSGNEGMRTAEVCLGGVDTRVLSSKTLQVIKQPGLYFIGEAVDVTGWLGGYNFQWAWSSGWVAGQNV